jgi:RHS repeat-associated protein
MKGARTLGALIALLAAHSARADPEPDFCPYGGPPPGKCSELNIGDPVFGPDLTSWYAMEDATVATATGPLSFERMYVSSDLTWNQTTPARPNNPLVPLVAKLPKPFGSTGTGHTSMRWWHNYFAFVAEMPDGNRVVRDTNGTQTMFKACTPSTGDCEMQPHGSNPSAPHRLFYGGAAGYVLRRGDGATLRFQQVAYSSPVERPQWWMLTRAEGRSGEELFQVTYQWPGGQCPRVGPSQHAPYVHRVIAPGGQGFELEYAPRTNSARATECPISKLHVIATNNRYVSVNPPQPRTPPWAQGGPPTSPPPSNQQVNSRLAASYSYLVDAAGDGQIDSVKIGSTLPGPLGGPVVEQYDYGSGASFSRTRTGHRFLLHAYTSDGRVASATGEGATWAFFPSDTSSSPGCVQCGDGSNSCCEPCDPQSQCCRHSPAPLLPIRRRADKSAGRGDGSGGVASLASAFSYSRDFDFGHHGARLYKTTEACAADPDSCSGGATAYEHRGAPLGNTSPGAVLECSAAAPGYLHAVLNKRGFYTVTPNVAVLPDGAGSSRLVLEQRKLLKGANDIEGATALEREDYSYFYTASGRQLRERTTRPSVLAAAPAVAVQATQYDVEGRLAAEYREGTTLSRDGSLAPRRVKTFFRLVRVCEPAPINQPETHGRALRIEGPCEVSSESAQSCSGTGYPVTEFTYYADSAPGTKGGRLAKVVRYPDSQSCSGGLTEEYLDYTVEGDPLQTRDANGVITTFTYEERHLTSKTVGSRVWRYRWAEGQMAEVIYPEGNREVFCYRKSTPGPGCTGGVLTPKLQWKARTAVSDGSTWSEKVLYNYRDVDEALLTEVHRGACFSGCGTNSGEVRSVRRFDNDLHGRPTFEAAGKLGAVSTQTVRGYDGTDNLALVGHSFNAPPSFCKSGGLPSELCVALSYDGANRLVSLEEHPGYGQTSLEEHPGYGQTVQTRLAHDVQGNVCAVAVGAAASAPTCNPPTPDPFTAYYRHDDFGNVVEVRLPNQNGVTRMLYDAAGNMTFRKTPSQSNGHLLYEHDALGRRLTTVFEVVEDPIGFAVVIYRATWDSAGQLPPGCPALANTRGRSAKIEDPVGTTFLSYDEEGRLVLEARLPLGESACGPAHTETAPHTAYAYSPNGDLASITYPHGRVVTYVPYQDLARRHRTERVNVAWRVGGQWITRPMIANISWEPYGGLRSYQAVDPAGPTSTSIEYALGDDSSVPKSSPCSSTTPAPLQDVTDDDTARLRALLVTRVGASGVGNVFRRWYTWKGDMATKTQTCFLGHGPAEEEFGQSGASGAGYDRMLRLVSAAASPVGAFDALRFEWDPRGNPIRRWLNATQAYDFTLSGVATHPDEVVGVTANAGAGTQLALSYASDDEGRVTDVTWPMDSTGHPNHSLRYVYGPDPTKGEVDTAMNAAAVKGLAYFNYYFDGQGRRRKKIYPSGGSDEFFYDTGRQLLEDRGQPTVFPIPGVFEDTPIDEYVWLDGRPIALVRGRFNHQGVRQDDGPFNCIRNDELFQCGAYFPVTDNIGKPVVLLDPRGRIAGTGEYDPFGHVNRRQVWGESQHPYPSGVTVQAPVIHQDPLGLELDVRVQFHTLDTEGCLPPQQPVNIVDPVWLVNASTSARVGPYGGHHRGAIWSDWINASGAGDLYVRFEPDGQNRAPDQNGCATGPANGFAYSGYSVRQLNFRRYESGVSPAWLPLRFPGQYHDDETDLFENGHRNMDGFLGRYLQPEPVLQEPAYQSGTAKTGRSLPSYAYALNNPISTTDPDGLFTVNGCNDLAPKAQALTALAKSEFKKLNWPDTGQSCTKSCIESQLEKTEVVCNSSTVDYCAKAHGDIQGRNFEQRRQSGGLLAYAQLGSSQGPNGRCLDGEPWIGWCQQKVSDRCIARIIIHEAAHNCGWKHDAPPSVVPGHNGIMDCQ